MEWTCNSTEGLLAVPRGEAEEESELALDGGDANRLFPRRSFSCL